MDNVSYNTKGPVMQQVGAAAIHDYMERINTINALKNLDDSIVMLFFLYRTLCLCLPNTHSLSIYKDMPGEDRMHHG